MADTQTAAKPTLKYAQTGGQSVLQAADPVVVEPAARQEASHEEGK